MISSVAIAAYLALFLAVGSAFLVVNLIIGWFIRPHAPNAEKLEVYECGEPTIGSSFVQFDLRFYVVALLFIIFDVEIAFFFPWATVFGKAVQLSDPNVSHYAVALAESRSFDADAREEYDHLVNAKLLELGVDPALSPAKSEPTLDAADVAVRSTGSQLARLAMIDIAVFFAVLMVGFAYVWKRGDLDWVRVVSHERAQSSRPPGSNTITQREPAYS